MTESLDKVIIPADMIEAAEMLPHDEMVEYLAAIVEYAFAQREPKLTGASAALFHTSRGRLDLSRERLLNGKKGGKQTRSKSEANHQANAKQTPKQTRSKSEANPQANAKQTQPNESGLLGGVRVGVRVRDKEKYIYKEKDEANLKQTQSIALVDDPDLNAFGEPLKGNEREYSPPTPTAVNDYILAQGGYPIDAEAFCNWYADHGWPPKGWHGTAMNWSTRDHNEKLNKQAKGKEVTLDDFKKFDSVRSE